MKIKVIQGKQMMPSKLHTLLKICFYNYLSFLFIPAKKISLAGFLAKGQIQLHIIIKLREVKNPLIFITRQHLCNTYRSS